MCPHWYYICNSDQRIAFDDVIPFWLPALQHFFLSHFFVSCLDDEISSTGKGRAYKWQLIVSYLPTKIEEYNSSSLKINWVRRACHVIEGPLCRWQHRPYPIHSFILSIHHIIHMAHHHNPIFLSSSIHTHTGERKKSQCTCIWVYKATFRSASTHESPSLLIQLYHHHHHSCTSRAGGSLVYYGYRQHLLLL